MLTDEDDIELVKKGLGFSGISFRNSMKEYLYKGSSCLNEVIRKDFLVEHKRLIDRIVNDRNFYTHSSNRTTAQMHFDEMLDVTSVCKEIYRILILNEMGIPRALLMQRFFHNRKSEAVFSKVLGLELCAERELSKYDRDMWHFSD